MDRTVTSDQYEQICQLLREANTCREMSKSRHLTLAQKLELQRESKRLMEQARGI